MATATIKLMRSANRLDVTSTFEGKVTTERYQYADAAAAQEVLDNISRLDTARIERETGARVSISEVEPEELPA